MKGYVGQFLGYKQLMIVGGLTFGHGKSLVEARAKAWMRLRWANDHMNLQEATLTFSLNLHKLHAWRKLGAQLRPRKALDAALNHQRTIKK